MKKTKVSPPKALPPSAVTERLRSPLTAGQIARLAKNKAAAEMLVQKFCNDSFLAGFNA